MQLSTKRGLSKTKSLIIQEKQSPYKMKRCDTNHLWFSLVQEYVMNWYIEILKYVDFCFCQKRPDLKVLEYFNRLTLEVDE